ncbi:MAG: TIR domain-containing protein [Chitinophagales bacterium]
MRTKVFVSYRKEDEKYFRKIRKWAINQDFGEFDIFMTSSFDKGMRTRTGKLIKGRLEQKIHEAKFIVVIVGDENESHPWRKMDEMAVQKNKKRFYMRIPYTSDGLPPEFEEFQQLAYNPNAIEKLMRDWVTLYGEDEPIIPYVPKYKPRHSRSDSNGGGYRPRNDNYRSRNDGYTPRYNRDNRDNSDNRNRDYNSDRNRSYDKPYDNNRGYDRDRPSYNRPYNNDRSYNNRDQDRPSDRPYEKKKYYKRSDRNSSSDKPQDNTYRDTENNNSDD